MDVDFGEYDYVALSDQDDIWLEDKLISGVLNLENTNYCCYSCEVMSFWPDGRMKKGHKATQQKKYDYLFEGPGAGCTFVIKKKIAQEIQGYFRFNKLQLSGLDWHDWLIYAYARSKGYKWFIDPTPHMMYRQHGNNVLGANSGFKQVVKRFKKVEDGYAINQSVRTIRFLNLENNTFVKKWFDGKTVSYIELSKHARQCRRRINNQIEFLLSCFLMALLRTRIE